MRIWWMLVALAGCQPETTTPDDDPTPADTVWDGTALDDPTADAWSQQCLGSLDIDGTEVDPCPLADVRVVGNRSDASADLVLTLGLDDSCVARIDLDDTCGPGTYWVDGGVRAELFFDGCAGVSGDVGSGSLALTTLALAEVDGVVRVNLAGSLSLRRDGRRVQGEVALQAASPPSSEQLFERCSNEPVNQDFRDPSGGADILDLLFVIDDSCSMSEEQSKLASQFPQLLGTIQDVSEDFHIGVVTTDTNAASKSGRLQTSRGDVFLSASSIDLEDRFAELVSPGTAGAIDERGRRAAHMALTPPLVDGANQGFYREEAHLAVVFLSDENDASASRPTRNEFINFLRTLKTTPDRVTVHAIVGPLGGCPVADPGTEYIAVTNAVGGDHLSICEDDYTPILASLGDLSVPEARRFRLPDLPVLPSLTAELIRNGGQETLERGTDWSWEAPYLVLDGITLPDGAEFVLSVSYWPQR